MVGLDLFRRSIRTSIRLNAAALLLVGLEMSLAIKAQDR